MYVKILKTDPLGLKIQEMWDRAHECGQAALSWAKQQGGDYIREGYFNLGGGITTVHFNSIPPKGWIKAGRKYEKGEYMVSDARNGEELRKQVDALPIVTKEEFNALFGYNWSLHSTNKISFSPGIDFRHPEYILMEFADHTPYTPAEGMTEITVTEWRSLCPADDKEDEEE